MELVSRPLPGLMLLRLKRFDDSRGFFSERFRADKAEALGLPPLVQDNHSRSYPGVLRGLHYQYAPPQGKLVGVIRGKIWDVAVDARPESSSFGKHFGVELSDDNGLLLWVPGGFAHGFCGLGDEAADVLYKVSAHYRAESEGGIRFDDADLGISWPVENPILSDRDLALPSWREYCANPPSWERGQ